MANKEPSHIGNIDGLIISSNLDMISLANLAAWTYGERPRLQRILGVRAGEWSFGPPSLPARVG